MSRRSIFVTAIVLSVAVASMNQMAFAKEHHQLRKPQFTSEHFRRANGEPNYALTMALVESVVFLAIIFLAAIGREERGKEF